MLCPRALSAVIQYNGAVYNVIGGKLKILGNTYRGHAVEGVKVNFLKLLLGGYKPYSLCGLRQEYVGSVLRHGYFAFVGTAFRALLRRLIKHRVASR